MWPISRKRTSRGASTTERNRAELEAARTSSRERRATGVRSPTRVRALRCILDPDTAPIRDEWNDRMRRAAKRCTIDVRASLLPVKQRFLCGLWSKDPSELPGGVVILSKPTVPVSLFDGSEAPFVSFQLGVRREKKKIRHIEIPGN